MSVNSIFIMYISRKAGHQIVEIFNIMSNYILKRLLLVVDVNLGNSAIFFKKNVNGVFSLTPSLLTKNNSFIVMKIKPNNGNPFLTIHSEILKMLKN